MKKSVGKYIFALCTAPMVFSGCYKAPEMTLEEIEAYRAGSQNDLIERTVSRPWKDEGWKAGAVGGVWNTTISGDPKSFNLLIAERDGETSSILAPLTAGLVDYNTVKKEWVPLCAFFEIKPDEEKGTLDVVYTLRDGLYWSFYNNAKPKVKVTSDDVVFWYNEIMCDQEMGSSAYNAQFMEMPDGSEGRITIEKIDEKSFAFHFPRIIAEPLLATNMSFGPAFLYKPAKDAGGAQGVKDLFSVATNPTDIPSMGEYFITEYTPGQRVVYERNPDYWDKDENGQSIAYPSKKIAQIVGDRNTEYLLFKQEKTEAYSPMPEQLEDIVSSASNKIDSAGNILDKKSGFTVFNSAGSMSAPFWTFNQNPKNKDEPFYRWFTKKEFRQA
ncbi:MAG: ABC transporter substrate-binding protein, partial [Treponema sp.]|nr:ABC transporter substrate-binding protein [Treponema sp.]